MTLPNLNGQPGALKLAKHEVRFVEIVRAEGLAHECDRPERFFGPAALLFAKMRLGEWARTAPATGGYNKCDFKIEWADGETYEGRADIQREHAGRGYDLGEHITSFLTFIGGLWDRPRVIAHYTEGRTLGFTVANAMERYAQAVKMYAGAKPVEQHRAEIEQFLASHSL